MAAAEPASPQQQRQLPIARRPADQPLTPLCLHVSLEVCTAARPSTFLRGTSAAYQSAAERLQAGLQALSAAVQSTVVLSVNMPSAASPRKCTAATSSTSSFKSTNPWSGKSFTPGRRPPPPPPSFLSSGSAVAAAHFAKEPAGAHSSAPFPRVGAFEVSFRIVGTGGMDCGGGLLYSKLQQSRWPSTSSVLRALGERLKLAAVQLADAEPAPADAPCHAASTQRLTPRAFLEGGVPLGAAAAGAAGVASASPVAGARSAAASEELGALFDSAIDLSASSVASATRPASAPPTAVPRIQAGAVDRKSVV